MEEHKIVNEEEKGDYKKESNKNIAEERDKNRK